MKFFHVTLILLLVSNFAWSQQHSSKAYDELGDSLFRNHHYHYAAIYHEKALKNASHPEAIMLKIAKSYVKLNVIDKAHEWFSKAKSNGATFSNEEVYLYAQVLAMENKRTESMSILRERVKQDPNAWQERKFLDDLENYSKYFEDSVKYTVKSLSINTPASEFAPAFYKDGIVYTAAVADGFAKKKYHWDNSHYLNLMVSKIQDNVFQKPTSFEKELNSKYHDGPAVFYNDFQGMIVNRNQEGASHDEGGTTWHMGLFNATFNAPKSTWTLLPLPFVDATHSYAHPNVSEDGTVLYFISNRPGGYGGTDIYRSIQENGKWSDPFNLGPVINTAENETFPFFVNDALYFSSNGHGGMGGLDIYRSNLTVNGFAPPLNLGSPINSSKDDFSFITTNDQRSGYFASSRNGNDDLFSYQKTAGMIPMLAHVFDGKTKGALDSASIQIMTATQNDLSLITGADGNVSFQLPEGTDYIVIASKDEKVGMLTGFAATDASQTVMTHQVPVFGDTTQVPCVGTIQDKHGIAQQASSIQVIDKTTGKELSSDEDLSMISFLGEKDHTYDIVITNEVGDTTVQTVRLKSDDAGTKTWSMVLKERSRRLVMAARIFNADNQQPLANADVKVITFSEPDLELTANENGVVEFELAPGTAYMVIGSKDNHTGMHSGMAEKGEDKANIIHPVPAHGDPPPPEPKLVIALVTNAQGEVIENATAEVTDKISGERVSAKVENGVLHFVGERGKTYNIAVQRKGYTPSLEEHTVSEQGSDAEKISLIMEKEAPPVMIPLAVRVYKEIDGSALAHAEVKVISFTEPDLELVADDKGISAFTLPEGTAYMVVGSRDGYVGMHNGSADKGTERSVVIHPIAAKNDSLKSAPVVARIVDDKGNLIADASVIVSDKKTKEQIQSQSNEGILSFMGESGKEYTLTIEHENTIITKDVAVSKGSEELQKLSVPISEKKVVPMYEIAVHAFSAQDHAPLSGANIRVISFIEADQELAANEKGDASFTLPQGTDYMVVASKDGFVGMHAGTSEEATSKDKIVHQIATFNENNQQVPVVAKISGEQGETIQADKISVTENASKREVPFKIEEGLLSFLGEKGKDYTLTVSDQGQATSHQIEISRKADDVQKVEVIVPVQGPSVSMHVIAVKVTRDAQSIVRGADVRVISFVDEDRELISNQDGVAEFALAEGSAFMVVAKKDGAVGMTSGIAELSTSKKTLTHSILIKGDSNQIPVVTLLVDEDKNPLTRDPQAKVTNTTTGQDVDFDFDNGVLSFLADKTHDYTIEVKCDDNTVVKHDVKIDSATEVATAMIAVEKEKTPVNADGKMIIFHTDDGAARVYVQQQDAFGEVVQKKDGLYVEHHENSRFLGKGTLRDLISGNTPVFKQLGIADSNRISLRNIYFNFNSANLDDQASQELQRVTQILNQYQSLKLVIRAHADDRGQDLYNLNLSKKRARAVETYLIKSGIKQTRVLQQAVGEKEPAVSCGGRECSEEEHKRNRRAEFVLESSALKLASNQSSGAKSFRGINNNLSVTSTVKEEDPYQEVLLVYGDKVIDGIVYKVTLGAYRHNTELTFEEFKKLGTVEVINEDGVTYYYLASFETLGSAEHARREVIRQGIADASISIFWNAKAITLKKMIALAK